MLMNPKLTPSYIKHILIIGDIIILTKCSVRYKVVKNDW